MSYKSAAELDITPGERKWLIETMKVLKTVKWGKRKRIDGVNMAFDMSLLYEAESDGESRACNTVGCIKGWMGTLAAADKQLLDLPGLPDEVDFLGKDGDWVLLTTKAFGKLSPHRLEKGQCASALLGDWVNSAALEKLFYPESGYGGEREAYYNDVTPAIACRAIESFLQNGQDGIDWGAAQRDEHGALVNAT